METTDYFSLEVEDLTVSYSLGDAIDWKLGVPVNEKQLKKFSYSLGDAIDWKPLYKFIASLKSFISYSLGDAIDWKHEKMMDIRDAVILDLLLARGRDRLETPKKLTSRT